MGDAVFFIGRQLCHILAVHRDIEDRVISESTLARGAVSDLALTGLLGDQFLSIRQDHRDGGHVPGRTLARAGFLQVVQDHLVLIGIGGVLAQIPGRINTGCFIHEIDLDAGIIRNLTSGAEYRAEPFPPFIQTIITHGGLMQAVRDGVL